MNNAAQDLMGEGLLTVADSAKFSGLGKSTLYKAMESGDLSYAKIGSARRIPKKALIDFLARSLIMR